MAALRPSQESLFSMSSPDPVIRGATLDGPGRIYRLTLWREWDRLKPRVLFVGHNPSTADGDVEDPTTRRWQAFARRWGFGAYTAVNLYPFRAADPDECYRWRDGDNGIESEVDVAIAVVKNLEAIRLQAADCQKVVVCWGDLPRERVMIGAVLKEIGLSHRDVYCFGLTKNGNPKHPMARGKSRVPDEFEPVPFPPLTW